MHSILALRFSGANCQLKINVRRKNRVPVRDYFSDCNRADQHSNYLSATVHKGSSQYRASLSIADAFNGLATALRKQDRLDRRGSCKLSTHPQSNVLLDLSERLTDFAETAAVVAR